MVHDINFENFITYLSLVKSQQSLLIIDYIIVNLSKQSQVTQHLYYNM